MDQIDEGNDHPGRGTHRSRSRAGVTVLAVVLIIVGISYAAYWAMQRDTSLVSTETTVGGVSDSDQVIIELPQEPSLSLVSDGGSVYVENDGNVTMSDVEVRDSSGGVVCSLGEIAPGDRSVCDGAEGELTASGTGPQGQVVTVSSE